MRWKRRKFAEIRTVFFGEKSGSIYPKDIITRNDVTGACQIFRHGIILGDVECSCHTELCGFDGFAFETFTDDTDSVTGSGDGYQHNAVPA